MRTLSLGYSPCPNDTFIFYALTHGRITASGLCFRELLEDVETLNQMALHQQLDITKVSFHAFGHLRENYCLLRTGGALGKGCGPLLVAREDILPQDLTGKIIAVPGRLTTALLLLQIFDPSLAQNVRIMPFHEIIDAVKNGQVDAGLIIHESRFTYHESGLSKTLDLGEWWERETGLPLPLGAILAKRALGTDTILKAETLIRQSLAYAFSHRDETYSYIMKHAQEMENAVIDQHIALYVNRYTEDIGEEGRRAVEELLRRAETMGLMPKSSMPLFPVR